MTKKLGKICLIFAKKEKFKTLKNRKSAYLSIIMDCNIIIGVCQKVNRYFKEKKNYFSILFH